MKKKIIVLNGIHGSGKTSLGKIITAQIPGTTFFGEIGGMLRAKMGHNAMHPDEWFDKEITKQELERDYELQDNLNLPLVETWHFGNLAYIETRSPKLAPKYKEEVREKLTIFDPVVIYLDISEENFRARASEKIRPEQMTDLINFYNDIKANLFKGYADFGITPIVVNNNQILSETKQQILEQLAL